MLDQQSFPRPNLEKAAILGLSTEKGEITGVGIVKPTYEAIIALDLNQPRRVLVNSMKDLITGGLVKSDKLGIEEWHTFVEPEFANILLKHFNFVRCQGESLLLKLR